MSVSSRILLRVLGLLVIATTPATARDSILIKGGTVFDGTGAEGKTADVWIENDRIREVGLDLHPGPETRIVDARGLIVCPGFIDLHTHSDSPIVQPATRSNLNYQRQGVTTIVTGNCGSGALDVAEYFAKLESSGAGTNVIHLVPHNAVRIQVVGRGDRTPSASQLEEMRKVVDQQMKAGAWGLSTGLIYQPGVFAKTPELIELSKVVARHGGLYASHIRDEGRGLLKSIDEAITIGKEAGLRVHISHLKASGKSNWGLTDRATKAISDARASGLLVTADQYPYTASSTRLAAMIVPPWASQGSTADFTKLLDHPVDGPRLRAEIQRDLDARDGGASVRIARYSKTPRYVGKSLTEIAKENRCSALEVALEIERNGGAQAISFGMSEDDVRSVMKQDFVATASDGGSHLPTGTDRPHPRSYGTFPRKIRYALETKTVSLAEAIRSSSGLPAQILGIADRGVIRRDAYADLLVFDPKVFRDEATFEQPIRYPNGVRLLLVNGVAVVENDKGLAALPGRPLKLKKDGPATLILGFQRIWTGNAAQPWADAVAVRDGEIVGVGSASEMERFRGPKTLSVTRRTAFAMPGLIDAHGHLISLGEGLEDVELRGITSLAEVARLIRERIAGRPGDGWILGSHWDQSLWPGGEFPTKSTLDAAAPNRPVWLRRVDGHAGWANSEAMRRAGITKESKAPSDGQIIRDANGEPTGVFIDGAMGLVTKVIPDATEDEIARRILAAQSETLAAGLTGVHDAGISRTEAAVFRELDREGKLKLRIYGMASPPGGREVAFAQTKPTPAKASDRFELTAIKLFADGAMGSRGGLLFEPYSDDPHNRGLPLIDPKTLEQTTIEALKNGWQVNTHAIGDKGNSLVLDAYESALKSVAPERSPRLRIEHAQVVRKADVKRFADLKVIASMQPSHSSDDMRWADARLGPERVAGAYAWRWFLDAKVRVAFGSDFPVAIVNPFYGIYCALTRQDIHGMPKGGWHPDQRMTIEETLTCFTSEAAYAAFAEKRVGTLKVGMRADLTVVDRDPFKAKPLEILDTKVLMTIIDGEIVYSSNR